MAFNLPQHASAKSAMMARLAGGYPRLAVVVDSATIYPPNLVVSLPTLSGVDPRWADHIITWDVSAFIWSYANESLFIDTFSRL